MTDIDKLLEYMAKLARRELSAKVFVENDTVIIVPRISKTRRIFGLIDVDDVVDADFRFDFIISPDGQVVWDALESPVVLPPENPYVPTIRDFVQRVLDRAANSSHSALYSANLSEKLIQSIPYTVTPDEETGRTYDFSWLLESILYILGTIGVYYLTKLVLG